MGEHVIAYAISAHYTKWGNPARSLLDKALLACDELTGFIVACSQVRPEGFKGMKAKSVIKKLKQKNIGVLITDHNVRETLKIVDRVNIVNEGMIYFSGKPEEAISDERIKKFYLGSNFSI